MKTLAAIASAAALFAQTALAQAELDPIVIKGSKFFYSGNGTQFFIKGIAYQRKDGTISALTTRLTFRQRSTAQTRPLRPRPRRVTEILLRTPNVAAQISR